MPDKANNKESREKKKEEHRQLKKLLLGMSWTAVSHACDFALLANTKIAIFDSLIKLIFNLKACLISCYLPFENKGVTEMRCLFYMIKLPCSWLQCSETQLWGNQNRRQTFYAIRQSGRKHWQKP